MRGVKISLWYIDPGVKILYDILTPGSIYRGVKILSHTAIFPQMVTMDGSTNSWFCSNISHTTHVRVKSTVCCGLPSPEYYFTFCLIYHDYEQKDILVNVNIFRGFLPKGPYLPCASMAGRALLAGYPWFFLHIYGCVHYNWRSLWLSCVHFGWMVCTGLHALFVPKTQVHFLVYSLHFFIANMLI